MSEEPLYRVAFTGVLTGEFDLETTKARFARLFRLTPGKTDQLFSGREYILKDRIREDVAMTFAMRIAEAGCECYIEEVPVQVITARGPVPDRRHGERRVRFRRAARAGAGPDRRSLAGRRRTDRPAEAESRQARR